MVAVFIMEKTITELEVQKKDPNRINVYLNDEFAFGISRFVGISLKRGDSIDEDSINRLIIKDERERAFQRALSYISYQPRSAQQVINKLTEVGFNQGTIEDVISELCEKQYLDDKAYAHDWVASRVKSKPRSRQMLRFELRDKRISEEFIEEAISTAPENDELAFQLGKKYIHRFRRLDDKEFEKKMTGVFARRAFPFSVIKLVISKLIKIRNESN